MHNLKSQYIKLIPDKRLYQCEKPLVALTGGIASGKSTVSQKLVSMGIPLIDADKLVKEIYQQGKTKTFVKDLDKSFVTDGEVNFPELRKAFFTNEKIKEKVETFIYQKLPIVFQSTYQKLNFSTYNFLVYDIPLLFEKNLQDLFDVNIMVYAPRETQLQRIISRDQCTIEVANSILDQQISTDSKRQKSQFVIDNSSNLEHLDTETNRIIDALTRT